MPDFTFFFELVLTVVCMYVLFYRKDSDQNERRQKTKGSWTPFPNYYTYSNLGKPQEDE